MAVAHRAETPFLSDEYLAMEEVAEHRSEFYRGKIVAMPSNSVNHNRIVGDLAFSLHNKLRSGPCEVFVSDMRLLVKRCDLYTYPDLMVICNGLEFAQGRSDTITNPVLIIEVLSPSTESYDRGKKFEFYRTIEGFQEYVLIDQQRRHVERFRPLGVGRWELTTFDATDQVIELTSIGVELTLDSVYDRVDLESETT